MSVLEAEIAEIERHLLGEIPGACPPCSRRLAELAAIVKAADDLVRQRAEGLEDIFEDNFLKLAAALGVPLTDDE